MKQLYLPLMVLALNSESPVYNSGLNRSENMILYRMVVDERLNPEDIFLFKEPFLEII